MKRTKYTVNVAGEVARFSSVRDAMLFAIMQSERLPTHLIEVVARDGIVGQYWAGTPTPEFTLHHAGVFQ
jgi:hypothetical protein